MESLNKKKNIAIVDAGRTPTLIKQVIKFVEGEYDVVQTKGYEADYVFHSCLGYEVLKYSGIRIFVTGENVTPDFNICDYALAFDHLSYGDRYMRTPLFRFYKEAYGALCSPRPDAKEIVQQKKGFCAYVMSNTKNSAPERTELFERLSAYKPIASGGKWNNNVGGPVADKIAFQSDYKFVIAFENSSTPGYLTEKFAQAAQSNAIPIYWGDPTIAQQFNPKAFINCHDYPDMQAVVEKIKQIDQNDDIYLSMLSEPWFPEGKEPSALQKETIQAFLANIFDQPYEEAYRRNRSRWGMKYQKRLLGMASPLYVMACKYLKELVK